MKLFSCVFCNKFNTLRRSKFSNFLLYNLNYHKKFISNNAINNTESTARTFFEKLIEGNRAFLAQSITLVESLNPIKRQTGQIILALVMKHLQEMCDGLSGPPGAGKSTFIEAFGIFLINKGHKVAVLAVDPSSKSTGGSLMGDKTRMPELTLNHSAYIRPSPSSGTLGGVARNTNEAIVLCEGAGYDIILVETMGVGQSEFAVADMVDMFCLILPPAGGDELQGLKRGITEVSDLVIVNKFDGELMAAARRVASEYLSALKFIRKRHPNWRPTVCKVSSVQKTGFDDLWEKMSEFYKNQLITDRIEMLRREQRLVWMWGHVKDDIMKTFESDERVLLKLKSIQDQVRQGLLSSGIAADILLNEFLNKKN